MSTAVPAAARPAGRYRVRLTTGLGNERTQVVGRVERMRCPQAFPRERVWTAVAAHSAGSCHIRLTTGLGDGRTRVAGRVDARSRLLWTHAGARLGPTIADAIGPGDSAAVRAVHNGRMRLDHVSYACGPEGLTATVDRLGAALGTTIVDGGVHPRFGTTNAILPLADNVYLEVVGLLEHPAADKAPFGQAVKRRVAEGGGWLGWVVAVGDLTPVEERLGRSAVPGSRHRPDGHELRWRQVGVSGMVSDPQLPFFVEWESAADHPSVGASGDLRLERIEMAGDREALLEWLDGPTVDLGDVAFDWVDGRSGVVAVHIATPNGVVRLT